MPLAEFKSLQYALQNSELVALYFAASWCPMSTPISKLIHKHLDEVLLPVPTDNGNEALLQRHGLSLVYVSSDHSAESMQDYLEKPKEFFAHRISCFV